MYQVSIECIIGLSMASITLLSWYIKHKFLGVQKIYEEAKLYINYIKAEILINYANQTPKILEYKLDNDCSLQFK